MSYATTTALQIAMFGVDFSATGMPTMGAKAIEQAEAEVNKYLSKRYDLSTSYFQTYTSTPPIVRMMTEQYAEGQLWQWLSRGGKETLKRGEDIKKGVLENLKAIMEWKMDLVDTAGSLIPESSNSPFRVQCNSSDYTPTFDEGDELLWVPDSDKLQDIQDAKD